MSVSAWIVVGDQPTVGNLVTVARSLGGPVAAVVAGPRAVAEEVAASGVDQVVWCSAPDDVPAEARAAAVAERRRGRPAPRRPGRPQPRRAGAARRRRGPAGGRGPDRAATVSIDGDVTTVVNAVFGDIADETIAVSGPVALLLEGGSRRRRAAPPRPSRRCPSRPGPEGDRDQDARLRPGGPQLGPPGDRRRPRRHGQGGPGHDRGARPRPRRRGRLLPPGRRGPELDGQGPLHRQLRGAYRARSSTSPSASPASSSTWSA